MDLKNSFVKGALKANVFTPRNRNKTKSLFITPHTAGQDLPRRLEEEIEASKLNKSHCSSFDDLEDNVDEFEMDEDKSF